MSGPVPPGDPGGEERRRIVRRATLYSAGLFLTAVVVGLLGAALVAWLLSTTGLPFWWTWLVVAVIVVLVPLLGVVIGTLREKKRGPDQ